MTVGNIDRAVMALVGMGLLGLTSRPAPSSLGLPLSLLTLRVREGYTYWYLVLPLGE
jgi:hypothetical protein